MGQSRMHSAAAAGRGRWGATTHTAPRADTRHGYTLDLMCVCVWPYPLSLFLSLSLSPPPTHPTSRPGPSRPPSRPQPPALRRHRRGRRPPALGSPGGDTGAAPPRLRLGRQATEVRSRRTVKRSYGAAGAAYMGWRRARTLTDTVTGTVTDTVTGTVTDTVTGTVTGSPGQSRLGPLLLDSELRPRPWQGCSRCSPGRGPDHGCESFMYKRPKKVDGACNRIKFKRAKTLKPRARRRRGNAGPPRRHGVGRRSRGGAAAAGPAALAGAHGRESERGCALRQSCSHTRRRCACLCGGLVTAAGLRERARARAAHAAHTHAREIPPPTYTRYFTFTQERAHMTVHAAAAGRPPLP